VVMTSADADIFPYICTIVTVSENLVQERQHTHMDNVALLSLGPSAWKNLPPTLRVSSTTLEQFQNKLKTVLFYFAYQT